MPDNIVIVILILVCVVLCGICLGQKMKYEIIIDQLKDMLGIEENENE